MLLMKHVARKHACNCIVRINLPSGRILALLLFTLTGLARVSAGMGLPSETKIEPDRKLFSHYL